MEVLIEVVLWKVSKGRDKPHRDTPRREAKRERERIEKEIVRINILIQKFKRLIKSRALKNPAYTIHYETKQKTNSKIYHILTLGGG